MSTPAQDRPAQGAQPVAPADRGGARERAGARNRVPGHKHQQIRDYLESLIENELSTGEAIPSERLLTTKFDVSRMTVRHAIDSLVNEGLLERVQGRGTFVSDRAHREFELRLTTFGEEMRHRGLTPSTRVLVADRAVASLRLAEALGVRTGDALHHLERLRFADGLPVSIEEAWLPVALLPHLLDDGVPESVYQALRDAGCPPHWGEDAIAADLAPDRVAELLDVPTPYALLRTRRVTYGPTGPVMFSQSWTRSDRYTLIAPLREPHRTLVPRTRR